MHVPRSDEGMTRRSIRDTVPSGGILLSDGFLLSGHTHAEALHPCGQLFRHDFFSSIFKGLMNERVIP